MKGSFKGNVLDKLTWHADGEYFPAGTPREQAATHMGMFLAWAIEHRLASAKHGPETSLAKRLRERSITPGQYFRLACGEWLQAEDFNERGERFADAVYDEYLYEYGYEFSCDLDSLYYAPDTWVTYEVIRELIAFLWSQWSQTKNPVDT